MLRHVPLGAEKVDVDITRSGTMLLVKASGSSVNLGSRAAGAKFEGGVLRIPLPAVEAGLGHALPQPGAVTQQLKVLDQQTDANSLTLRLAAPANSRQMVMLRVNDLRSKIHVEGAQVGPSSASLRPMEVDFGAGDGYVEKTVKVTW